MKNDMKEVFSVLLLFFCMTAVSLVMIFSQFEKEVIELWSNQEALAEATEKLTENEIFDLDNVKMVGGVDEKAKFDLVETRKNGKS